MAGGLDLTSSKRSYLIAETCLNYDINLNSLSSFKEKIINQVLDLPFINGKLKNVSFNWEPFVYPVQSLSNKSILKDSQAWLASRAHNLESIGTSADFSYNDLQVIFAKAYELAQDLSNKSEITLSRGFYNKLRNQNSFNHEEFQKNNNKSYDQFELQNIVTSKIIAEIGINHNGSSDQLLNLSQLAINSGCDLIKFQYFKAESRIGSK